MRPELIAFLIVFGALIVWWFTKARGVTKPTTTPVTPKPEGLGWKQWAQGRMQAVLLIPVGYIVFLLIVRFLITPFWDWWWGNQSLFWLSQVGALTIIALITLPLGKAKVFGWVVASLLAVALVVGTLAQLPKPPPTTTAPATAASARNPCGEPKPLVALPHALTRVEGKVGCRYDIRRDNAMGEANYLAPAYMRPNGREDLQKIDGVWEGEYQNPTFHFNVDFYTVMPVGDGPIYFVVGYVPEGR